MLHEKELVLNKQDTANILSAVDIARTMAGLLQSLNSNIGFNMLGLSNHTASSAPNQNVVINASFPNATNRFEIEKAFNNLINRATQFVATPNK